MPLASVTVTERFTPAWLAELAAAASGATVASDLELVIEQIVTDIGDDGELAYAIRLSGGTVTVEPGRADDPDVTFTQDWATATAIATGELSAQAAFMAGRLRVGGDLPAVIERTRGALALDDVFALARPSTD